MKRVKVITSNAELEEFLARTDIETMCDMVGLFYPFETDY